MARKIPFKKFQSLWNNSYPQGVTPKNLNGSRELLLRKTIDNICMSADLSESTEDYAYNLCDGIVYLYSIGFRPSEIISHKILFQKILNLGDDIIEYGKHKSELFYLGLFIDLKINSFWKDIGFFKFLLKALKEIKNKLVFFSEKLKDKIESEFSLYNPEKFKLIFQLSLKSSA